MCTKPKPKLLLLTFLFDKKNRLFLLLITFRDASLHAMLLSKYPISKTNLVAYNKLCCIILYFGGLIL